MKTPIRIGATVPLSLGARELLVKVGIHIQNIKGMRVFITQHAAAGTSFQFHNIEKEFHIPARLVEGVFA